MGSETSGAEPQKLDILWHSPRDLQRIVEIDTETCDRSWNRNTYMTALAMDLTNAMIARIDGQVVGFMVYSLYPGRIVLSKIAVAADQQRRGVGSALFAALMDKLRASDRTCIGCVVPDSNLAAHLFLRHHAFKAIKVLRAFYDDSADAYQFEFSLEANLAPSTVLEGSNAPG